MRVGQQVRREGGFKGSWEERREDKCKSEWMDQEVSLRRTSWTWSSSRPQAEPTHTETNKIHTGNTHWYYTLLY